MRKRSDRGVALILALLVLVILVVVILQMTASSLHNRTVAENHLADLQNTYGTRAGYAQAILLLQADAERAGEVDSMKEKWASPFEFDLGRARVRVSISDSERFINLSQLVNEKGEPNATVVGQLKRLVKRLLLPADVADRIVDYIDGDSKGEFESRAKNDRLYNLEELLRIEGITPEILYGGLVAGESRKGLREFLTIWPRGNAPEAGGGKLNLNTAPAEVLQALSDDLTPGLADAIVSFRSSPGPDGRLQEFQKVDDLKRIQGMSDALYQTISPQACVKAGSFEIRVRSTVGNVEKSWVYVVQRKAAAAAAPAPGTPPPPPPATPAPGGAPDKAATHTLLVAQALNDFLSVRPPEEERR